MLSLKISLKAFQIEKLVEKVTAHFIAKPLFRDITLKSLIIVDNKKANKMLI